MSSGRSRRGDDSRGRSVERDRNVARPLSPAAPPNSARARTPSSPRRKEASPPEGTHKLHDIIMQSPKQEEVSMIPSPTMQVDSEVTSTQTLDSPNKEKGKMREGSGGYDTTEPDKYTREVPSSPASVKESASLQTRQRRSHSPLSMSRQYGHLPPAASLPHAAQHSAAPPLPTKPEWSRRTTSALPPNARSEGPQRTPTTQTSTMQRERDNPEDSKIKPSVSATLETEVRNSSCPKDSLLFISPLPPNSLALTDCSPTRAPHATHS